MLKTSLQFAMLIFLMLWEEHLGLNIREQKIKHNLTQTDFVKTLNSIDQSFFTNEENKLSENEMLLMDEELLLVEAKEEKNKISLEKTKPKLFYDLLESVVTVDTEESTDDYTADTAMAVVTTNTEDPTDDYTTDTTVAIVTANTEDPTDDYTTHTTVTADTEKPTDKYTASTRVTQSQENKTTHSVTSSFATETTTYTGDATPCDTCTEIPDNRPEANVTWGETGTECLFLRVNIQIAVNYETINSKTKSVNVTVPKEASTDGSSCQEITMTWSPYETRQRSLRDVLVRSEDINTVTLYFKRNDGVSISGIHAQIFLDNKTFPDAKNSYATIIKDDLDLFKSETGSMYMCSNEEPVETNNGTVVLSDVQIEGVQQGQNATNKVIDCNSEPTSDNSLGLILGVVAGVAALVAIIAAAAAFVIRKRRTLIKHEIFTDD